MPDSPMTSLSSTFDALVLRVKHRTQRSDGRMAHAGDLDLVIIRTDVDDGGAIRGRHVAQAHGGPQRMAVHAGANETDDGIALPNGLVVVQEGFRVRELELHQSLAASGMPLPQQRLAADEAAGFVPFDREAEAGLERGA